MPKNPATKGALWIGRILVWLIGLFILSGAINMLRHAQMVVDGMKVFGFPPGADTTIGVLALIASALTLIPKTDILGGLLMTAYFGGAVVTHIHASQPFWSPIVVAVVMWIGFWLKDLRVRAMLLLS